ncbi:hypothetical protein ACFWN1_32700 [Streptomyces sp. NPDC058459]|uniref:hypothetical protein n=1 Tax=Streptomyces sp. NPDC058459 TaxID=3346508 RepID=UPI00366A2810
MALALAAHLSPGPAHTADMEELGRLCGHTPHQTAELLDRLVTTGKLAFWRQGEDLGEVTWTLAGQAPGA